MLKWHKVAVAILLVVVLLVAFGCAPAKEVEKEPIVIGYVGQIASPAVKPAMDVQRMAIEEINAAGGILGRTVKYVVEDSKGETALAVEGVTRMVMEHKALVYFVEGRSEINLAVQEKAAALYREYPHIAITDGAMDRGITDKCIDEPEKYKFWFRNWDPEPTHFCWIGDICKFWKDVVGAKKVALLYENLAWTTCWREGDPEAGLPSWKDEIESYGLDVVYVEAVPARVGMYLPIFDAIAKAGADVIFYVSSWFTDTEVFAKQWAESAAKDIAVELYGGIGQTKEFWPLTGGKALGALTCSGDLALPINEITIPFIKKCQERGISLQWQQSFSYGSIYLLKAAIEKAKGTSDMDALIKALEEVKVDFPLGVLEFEETRIKPYFHSRVMADPHDPRKVDPRAEFAFSINQFQENGEQVIVYAPDWSPLKKYADPSKYRSPAELRKAAGW